MIRKPSRRLFNGTVSHYTTSYTQDSSGAKTPSYTLNKSMVALVMPVKNELREEYMQRNLVVSYSVFPFSLTDYDAVSMADRLVYDSSNLIVVGKENTHDRVYRIDCREEID